MNSAKYVSQASKKKSSTALERLCSPRPRASPNPQIGGIQLAFEAQGLYLALITLLTILESVSYLAAQNPSSMSAITGVVLDPGEAVVAGASVTLQTREGAVLLAVRADVTGSFRFDAVPQGSYTLTVEQNGFQPSASRIRVGARPPAALLIRLKVAEVKSEVTVTGQSNQVSVSNADNQDTVSLDRKALDDLPIFDQDYVTTMTRFLDAGAVATGGVTLI